MAEAVVLYLRLFYEFFKTGLFAVGGGMATIPFLYNMAEATGWFTADDVANMIAVGESTPGPIGVNMATYVGFHTAGVAGGVVATLGLITPSIIVILIIATFLKNFRDSRPVQNAFYGLRPASTGLIAAAGISVVAANLLFLDTLEQGFSAALFNWKGLALALVLWVLTNKVKKTRGLHPILFILASAAVGVAFAM